MNIKNWPYWLKGGVLASILSLISAIGYLPEFGIGSNPSFLGIDPLGDLFEMLIIALNPISFGAALNQGMGGIPQSTSEALWTLSISTLVSIIILFIVGSILGYGYGKLPFLSKKTKIIITVVIIVLIAILALSQVIPV